MPQPDRRLRQQAACDVYLNTMFFRVADGMDKAWAGPQTWLVCRQLGDTLPTDGRVLG
ncbi:MAG: hypothetical protein ACSLE6_14760 [Mycobacterium sp.]